MKQYTVNKGFITEQINGETVFFDSNRSIMFTLNETGNIIFTLLKQGKDTAQIVKFLSESFNQPEHKVLKDVRDFITGLTHWKILSSSKTTKKQKEKKD